jgi:hypothetical protein
LSLRDRLEAYLISNFFASRVRKEILKALSAKVSSSTVLAYCNTNGTRLKLSVGPPAGQSGRRVAFFYTEAIKKYGYLLDDSLLGKAYDRCQMFLLVSCTTVSRY